MKKQFLVFGVLTMSSLYILGQTKTDSIYSKKRVSKTDIHLVYSHYIQDGNHSAITGGAGTEKLIVYSPSITFKKQKDSINSYSINAGVDVISSASLDNIDFVVSSASRVSERGYINVTVNHGIRKKALTLSPSAYFSMESAYLSKGVGFAANHVNNDKTRELTANFEAFFDDLRWGRLNGEHPLRLVYPEELRYKEWYNKYRRQSYNLSLGIHQTLNKKMVLGFFPGLSYQHGLLATPYHRVYFTDNTERVENLPGSRLKIPVGIQLNSFIEDRYILRTYYRFYWDDFGIIAHTFDVALPIKISPTFTLAPFIRFYTQTGSSYFKPFAEHSVQETFYTSDYDLSAFNSDDIGMECSFSELNKNWGASAIGKLSLRYAYYNRTDGLHAHIITMLIDVSYQKQKNR